MKIYHNPRCSKSRQTLALIEERKAQVDIIKYLETPPTKEELNHIIALLGIQPLELVRKNETIWKEQFKGKTLTQEQVVDAMIEFPKLIERPIVISNNKAVLGRPPENVLELL